MICVQYKCILSTMKSDSHTLKWDISKGSPEDNLSFIKQVEMDLSNESVEDRRNGNRIKNRISWNATLSKFAWIPDQGSCQGLHGMTRGRSTNCCKMQYLLYSVSTFQYEARDLRHDMVQATMPPWEDVLVSLGLDGTIVTIYDPNISRAVESMRACPPRLMHEAMQKLGTIMQSRSLTTVTFPGVSKDFLSPMQFFRTRKFIARTESYVQRYLVSQVDLR